MPPVARHFLVSAALAAIMLAGCSSVVDTPNQQVQVLTPGAEGAKCTIKNDTIRYIAHPPETVFMRRVDAPLTVTCDAPGNRTKTIVVYPKLNTSTLGNVTTAGLGSVYDYFSGAIHDIPSPIIVDFRHTIATHTALPKYHNSDTVSPFAEEPEDMREMPLLHPGEQNLPVDSAPLREDIDASQDVLPKAPGLDLPTDTKTP